MKRGQSAARIAAVAAVCVMVQHSLADEAGGVITMEAGEPFLERDRHPPCEATNLVGEVRKWVSVSAFADIETAYLARGAVVDKRPYSAQFADMEFLMGDFGHVGGSAWSASSFSNKGQAESRRYAYNEVDYNLHYVYDWQIAEDWTLENRAARQWVTFPGYSGSHTVCEWQAAQALHNPYVTPYYLYRHACRPRDWNYWCVGLRRSFDLTEDLSLTVDAFSDIGDHRTFVSLYGRKPGKPSSRYHGGAQTVNLMLRLDYRLNEYLRVFAFVWQYDLVSQDAREAVKESSAPEAKRDITVGGVGIALNF